MAVLANPYGALAEIAPAIGFDGIEWVAPTADTFAGKRGKCKHTGTYNICPYPGCPPNTGKTCRFTSDCRMLCTPCTQVACIEDDDDVFGSLPTVEGYVV